VSIRWCIGPIKVFSLLSESTNGTRTSVMGFSYFIVSILIIMNRGINYFENILFTNLSLISLQKVWSFWEL